MAALASSPIAPREAWLVAIAASARSRASPDSVGSCAPARRTISPINPSNRSTLTPGAVPSPTSSRR